MVLAVVAVGVGALLCVYLWGGWAERARIQQAADEALSRAAHTLGLRFVPRSLGSDPSIAGKLDGFEVSGIASSGDGIYTRLLVAAELRIPGSIVVGSKGSWLGLTTLFSDEQTGDPAFDALVRVQGPEEWVRASLGEEARARLVALVDRGGLVRDAGVRFERAGAITEAATIVETVRAMVGVARDLALGADSVSVALAKNAQHDSMAGVRLRNLQALAKHARTSAAARWAVAAALRDQDAGVRLAAAALASVEDGTGTLLDLAADPTVEVEVRAQALRSLSSDRPDTRAIGAFAAALESSEAELQLAAVRAIGASRASTLAGRVLTLAARLEITPGFGADETLSAAVAETLGLLGDAIAEPALLQLLACQSAAVRCQAVIALGRIGTVRAVEPLLPLSKGLIAGHLETLAREAIRGIQGRLGDVEGGRLSVVDSPEPGGLSLAAPDGALSLVQSRKP